MGIPATVLETFLLAKGMGCGTLDAGGVANKLRSGGNVT